VKQGLDQDPDGQFVRHWVPELRPVPDEHLHAPWEWAGAGRFLGRCYPAPVVDPLKAARVARARVWAVRGQDGFRQERDRLLARHAAPKPPRDRRSAKPPDQLSLLF